MLLTAFHGMCMALADSVPGVSGGTIAFILGFYEHFLNALHDLFGKNNAARKDAFFYLVKLGVGWVVGMGLSVLVLSSLFESHVYLLSSAFFGLTLVSIPFIIKQEQETVKGHWGCLLFTVLGAAVVIAISAFRQGGAATTLDYAALAPMQYLYLFVCGMIAIAAMVLPGISGSTLLLIFGVYLPTVTAVKQLLTLQLKVLPGVMALGFGAVCGVAVSIGGIRMALQKFRAQMLYLILGLMGGSLYAIAMGPTTLKVPQAAMSLSTFSIVGFAVGAALLVMLEVLREKMDRCKTEGNAIDEAE
ncbi:MAG: DUF368 domain-containing protein [Pygmaiobacter sp.]|nr:DUF368 domain-containing protein [Pygmaiobacter sp.]